MLRFAKKTLVNEKVDSELSLANFDIKPNTEN